MKDVKANATLSDVHLLPYETGGRNAGAGEADVSAFERLISGEETISSSGEPAADVADRAAGADTADAGASEDASEEAEESGEGDTDSDQQEEQPDTSPKYRVKVQGEDVEVTLEELLSGYSRTSDYTRKTQEIAEQRKAVQAEAQRAREVRDQYAQQLAVLAEVLEQATPAEPDWEKLRQENPTEYAVQWVEHQQYRQQQALVRAQQERVYAEQLRDAEAQREALLAEESAKLAKALPEWGDAAKSVEIRQQLADYARHLGYTEDDLNSVVDHRIIILLDKARRYDALQSRAVQVQGKARPNPATRQTLTPGGTSPAPKAPETAENKARDRRLEQKMRRLADTGSARDAAAVFEELL